MTVIAYDTNPCAENAEEEILTSRPTPRRSGSRRQDTH